MTFDITYCNCFGVPQTTLMWMVNLINKCSASSTNQTLQLYILTHETIGILCVNFPSIFKKSKRKKIKQERQEKNNESNYLSIFKFHIF